MGTNSKRIIYERQMDVADADEFYTYVIELLIRYLKTIDPIPVIE